MSFIEIRFKGNLDSNMSEWFQGMTIQTLSPVESSLSGEVSDNSAIYGVLSTLSSLGISLLSVTVTDALETSTSTK